MVPSQPLPLPPNPFPQTSTPYHNAYQLCLNLENKTLSTSLSNNNSDSDSAGKLTPLISARLLGHLLRLVPQEHGRAQLGREIIAVDGDDGFVELAGYYVRNLIRVFKRAKGPTPPPSEHPSRPSSRDEQGSYTSRLEENTLDHHTAKKWALIRDDNRCVLSGEYDFTTFNDDLHDSVDVSLVPTEAVHIIPESTNNTVTVDTKCANEIGGDKTQQRHTSDHGGVWTVLSMFLPPNTSANLSGNNIHRLENILTLSITNHWFFDDLFLWLKPVENVPNQYTVHRVNRAIAPTLPSTLTFTQSSKSAQPLPLPSPDYLSLHALCCEVAHMSGVNTYLNEIRRDLEEIRVLAKDGSDARVLAAVLSTMSVSDSVR